MEWLAIIPIFGIFIAFISLFFKLKSERCEIRPINIYLNEQGYWELIIKNGGPGEAFNVKVFMRFRDKKILSELEINSLNPNLLFPMLQKQAVGAFEINAKDEQRYHVPENGLAFQIAQETPIIIQWKSKYGLPYKKFFYFSQSNYSKNTFKEINGLKKHIKMRKKRDSA
jgi:hypothetical protein